MSYLVLAQFWEKIREYQWRRELGSLLKEERDFVTKCVFSTTFTPVHVDLLTFSTVRRVSYKRLELTWKKFL